jgi:hypothetical protein
MLGNDSEGSAFLHLLAEICVLYQLNLLTIGGGSHLKFQLLGGEGGRITVQGWDVIHLAEY